MAREQFKVGIIGLGLMGGSAGLKLKTDSFASQVIGYDINPDHGKEALALGIVDEFSNLEALCRGADLIILAIPVNHALKMLTKVMNCMKPEAVVVDFGSTKEKICNLANSLPNRQNYVACHPIAGTENTGPSAAFAELFQNKVNIICDKETSSEHAIKITTEMSISLGMRIKFMDSASHDRHIAYVSHLSHISSFTLGQTVLEVEDDEKNIFDMAGSGFTSTVRLAKSSPEMWAPIFTENSNNILMVLDRYINNLNKFRTLIKEGKEDELNLIMRGTNIIRKVLEGDNKTETGSRTDRNQ